MNLRSSETRLKRQVSQLNDKIRQMEGRKRFDTSQAFQRQNDSENNQPTRTPLKGIATETCLKGKLDGFECRLKFLVKLNIVFIVAFCCEL